MIVDSSPTARRVCPSKLPLAVAFHWRFALHCPCFHEKHLAQTHSFHYNSKLVLRICWPHEGESCPSPGTATSTSLRDTAAVVVSSSLLAVAVCYCRTEQFEPSRGAQRSSAPSSASIPDVPPSYFVAISSFLHYVSAPSNGLGRPYKLSHSCPPGCLWLDLDRKRRGS